MAPDLFYNQKITLRTTNLIFNGSDLAAIFFPDQVKQATPRGLRHTSNLQQ